MEIDWIGILADAMAMLVPLIVVALGSIIIAWAKKRGAKQETLNLIEEAWALLSKCVLSVNQTLVDGWKIAGGLTDEQKIAAKQACIAAFEELLSDSMRLAIETTYGSLDKWLDTALEATVQEVKIAKNAA